MPATRHKVVLYNARAVFYTMPLALQAVASHLDPDVYDPQLIDGRLVKDPVRAVVESLDGALCLGVTVLSGAPIRDALAVSRATKAARPNLPVVWGGWHPSMFGTECLAEPSVDVTVQGQGEATFAEIADRLRKGETLEGCAGCCYRGPDGEPRANPPRALQEVNDLSPHRYDLIDVPSFFKLKGKRQLDYITSQGCHFRCAFCSDPFVYNRRWTGLDPERIGEELDRLWRLYQFDDVNFQDETFFTYPKRVEGIAEQLLRRNLNITWHVGRISFGQAVVADPNPASVNETITLSGNIDDGATGGATIASADFEIRDSDGTLVLFGTGNNSVCPDSQLPCPDDGEFDEVVEDVQVTIDPGDLAPSVYDACVRGTDADGNVGEFECIFLVVYDPDGDFVTGGGWIQSEAGDCQLDACATAQGKADFGFISKYKNGAQTPTGQTQFQFKAGHLNFHSDSYDWLVIAGARAQYKGSGTINGAGDYGFMLTAVDEKLTPSTSVDLFRIKIWDKVSNALAYDNQLGKDEFGDDATALGGGSIVIHSQ